MELIVTLDAERFAREAGGYLAARPERNVLATVLANSRQGLFGSDQPVFALGHGPAGEPVAAAMRTPPWHMLADGFEDPKDARDLIDCWLPVDPGLPGVGGQPATAGVIAGAWSEATGGRTRLDYAEAIYALTDVIPPSRPSPGKLRAARLDDRDTLIEWERAFAVETGIGHAEQAGRRVDHRLATGRQVVWSIGDSRATSAADARHGPGDDQPGTGDGDQPGTGDGDQPGTGDGDQPGRPVSTVGFNPTVAGTQRIGPVYTPPEHRGRGYATHAVAATSRQLLDGGAEQCILFTDLANPISNRIYASIGYVRFADWEEYRFLRR